MRSNRVHNYQAYSTVQNIPLLSLYTGTVYSDWQLQQLYRQVDWHGFMLWLEGRGLRGDHRRAMFNYAKKWCNVLLAGKVNEIEGIPGQKHVMMSLSNLAKYLGCYGRWKELKEQGQLKWTRKSSVDVFQQIYQNEVSDVLGWVDEVLAIGDEALSMTVVFMGLSGLRVCETLTAMDLIGKRGLSGYLSKAGVLEHFRYKELFLRGNKNAYVSVIPKKLLEELKDWKNTGVKYDCLVKRLLRKGLNARFYDLRRWYATELVLHGIPSEVADLLEGRVGSSVFVQSYLRPDFRQLVEKVKEIMEPYAERWLT